MLLVRNTTLDRIIEITVDGTDYSLAAGETKTFDDAYAADVQSEVAALSEFLSLDLDDSDTYMDITVTSAELLALFTTPKVLLPAVADKAYIPVAVYATMDYDSAAYSAGTDTLDIRYTDGSGLLSLSLSNAFVESTADAREYVERAEAAFAPVVNAPLVLSIANNPTLGDSDIKLRLYFKAVDSLL